MGYKRINYYHWFDTYAGGLLVQESIIRLVFGVSALVYFYKIFTYMGHYKKNWEITNKKIIDVLDFLFIEIKKYLYKLIVKSDNICN